MSEAPHTPATLDRIRGYALKGIPPGYVAAVLGWDFARLERVVNHHGITFPASKKAETKEPPNRLRWDGKYAWNGTRSVRLLPAEGRIFAVLARSPTYNWTHGLLAQRGQVSKRSMAQHLMVLRRSLRGIGLSISRRPYRVERL